MRSSVERHFGAPRLEINDHEVISPRIKGGVQRGGRLKTAESQGATSNSRKEIDKDLVVVYNCLRQGTAKLLLTIPFDDGDEADARGPFPANAGGAAASDQESLTLTLDDGEDSDDDSDAAPASRKVRKKNLVPPGTPVPPTPNSLPDAKDKKTTSSSNKKHEWRLKPR